ncbi:MAG: DUF2779 domain-containing protein [Candidatus Omnitrophica bacterium]|nr:DUF2779 domain-containing protein [Candidatus Omnitrophota bacterium]
MESKFKPILTKSRYMQGVQCSKLLWFAYNRKEEIPPIDVATQAIFRQGIQIGLLAQRLFPDGIKLERDASPFEHSKKSTEVLKDRRPIFEAGFVFSNTYALADILNPVGHDEWDLIEVKSSTQVKEEHYEDVAFQKYVYEGAGLKIRRCYLYHINNEYIRQGEIDPEALFLKVDITDLIKDLIPLLPKRIENMLQVIQGSLPDINIGPQCDSPYECPLKEACWAFLPTKDNIFVLMRGKKIAFNFMKKGLLRLLDIPDDAELTDSQRKQLKIHKTGTPYINRVALREFLQTLKYPLYFLDFETISSAVPLFDLSRPYERIPFQYSMFVVLSRNSSPQHFSFLWREKSDPRTDFIKQLSSELGTPGSIVAYNAAFEISVLEGVCETLSNYLDWFKDIKPSFVDLYEPFRNLDYYHPAQQGSASIKAVLPILTGKNYEALDISQGDVASLEYFRVTYCDAQEEERQRVYSQLQEYCDLDTYGMIDLLNALEKLAVE